jgi:prefoldin subunit 5
MERLEKRIAELTAERKALEETLADAYDPKRGQQLVAVMAQLEQAEAEWMAQA